MSEMVERMAKALRSGRGCENEYPCPFCNWGPDELTKEMDETGCEWLARVAIAAMREPTANMRWHGQNAIGDDIRFVSPQDIWQAMIDEALR